MKKIISYVGIVLLAVLAINFCTSCSSKDTLEKAVEEANKECPQDLGDGMVMEKFLMEGKDVVCVYSIEENAGFDVQDLSSQKSLMKAMMLEEMRNANDSDIDFLIKMLKENNADFIVRFKGQQSGQTFDIVLPSSEL